MSTYPEEFSELETENERLEVENLYLRKEVVDLLFQVELCFDEKDVEAQVREKIRLAKRLDGKLQALEGDV